MDANNAFIYGTLNNNLKNIIDNIHNKTVFIVPSNVINIIVYGMVLIRQIIKCFLKISSLTFFMALSFKIKYPKKYSDIILAKQLNSPLIISDNLPQLLSSGRSQ